MSNTNLHITRAQATSLLDAVRYEQTQRLADIAMGREPYSELHGRLKQLAGNESMLLAALDRIGDLEGRRVATVNRPW